MKLHSYVVRYDSGFAPNPFYGYCTLTTCKPGIRRSASVGDWVVGSCSNDKNIRRGGHLVYAMRVTETLNFRQYDSDSRFQNKKPYRNGSRKQSCGDNIYFRDENDKGWIQRDSFHSGLDGSQNWKHTTRDTGTDRVLVSDDFLYFGGFGPAFPAWLRDFNGADVCKSGIGRSSFDDPPLVEAFVSWIRSLEVTGFQSAPFEWRTLRGK